MTKMEQEGKREKGNFISKHLA